MDILGQSSLLVAVTSFALGMSALSRNVRNKLFLAYAVLTTLISGWALAFFLEKIWPEGSFYWWHLFFNIWIGPAGLVFIRLMVRMQDATSRRLLDVSFVLSIALSVALVFGFDSHPVVLRLIYFAPALIVLQVLQLMWLDRRLRRGIKLLPKLPIVGFGRRNWVYFGGLLVLCTSTMDHVEWMGKVVPSLGNIALTAYVFFISQAILQQRLLNFEALFSRFLVLLGVSLILAAVYSLLVAWIQDAPELFFLNSFITSFLIVTLLDPIRAAVGYLTRRLLSQKHLRLETTLREAQRRLAGILDQSSLFQAVLLTVDQALQPNWAALFILSADGARYRRVRSLGRPPEIELLTEVLANHNPLLEYCERQKKKGELPLLLDQVILNEIDRSASRQQRKHLEGLIEALKALGANLLIPLMDDAGRTLGFVTLYVPEPPEPWGSNWGLLGVMYPYFEQAAQTLKSMEVFVRSREKDRLAALGEMAAGLAHEIRNPLGAIKGAAQFLDPSSDRPESRFLRVIVEETDRLNRVVTQFLDYSKPPTTDFKVINLGELVEKTVELMRTSVDASGKPMLKAELTFRPPRKPIHVRAAPEQIQQVLINLIQNSLKAVEGKADGRVRIHVEGQSQAQGVLSEVALVIEDNGSGIKKENMEKLFIPFFTTSPSGTGLGLPISQKIIEAHLGRIEVSSEEGRFSRFSVILPLQAEAVAKA